MLSMSVFSIQLVGFQHNVHLQNPGVKYGLYIFLMLSFTISDLSCDIEVADFLCLFYI